MTKGYYPFKSAWAFRKMNNPFQILHTKEVRLPRSDNTVWIDWWLESLPTGATYPGWLWNKAGWF